MAIEITFRFWMKKILYVGGNSEEEEDEKKMKNHSKNILKRTLYMRIKKKMFLKKLRIFYS